MIEDVVFAFHFLVLAGAAREAIAIGVHFPAARERRAGDFNVQRGWTGPDKNAIQKRSSSVAKKSIGMPLTTCTPSLFSGP